MAGDYASHGREEPIVDCMPRVLRAAVGSSFTLRFFIALLAPTVCCAQALANSIWDYTASNLPAKNFKTLDEAESSMRSVPPDPQNLRGTLYSELVFQANGVEPGAMQRWYGVLPRRPSGFLPWTYWAYWESIAGTRQASEEAALQSAIDYLRRTEGLCEVVAVNPFPDTPNGACAPNQTSDRRPRMPSPGSMQTSTGSTRFSIVGAPSTTNARFHMNEG